MERRYYCCPVGDFSCPYFEEGVCGMYKEKLSPLWECDAFDGMDDEEIDRYEIKEKIS